MSRAISMFKGFGAGLRVAGELTLYPAHFNNGKFVNARCIIPAYANSNKGTNQDGTPGRSDTFRFVAWGKLAYICAKSLPVGKAFDCGCAPHSYVGNNYNPDGSLRLDAAGQIIQTTKVAFTIEDIVFGEESEKTVTQEIQMGLRPENWNVRNHPDYSLWTDTLKTRQAAEWDMVSPAFGYARIALPQGPNVQLAAPQQVAQQGQFVNAVQDVANGMNPNAAPVNRGFQAPVNQGFQGSAPVRGFQAPINAGFQAPSAPPANTGFQGTTNHGFQAQTNVGFQGNAAPQTNQGFAPRTHAPQNNARGYQAQGTMPLY